MSRHARKLEALTAEQHLDRARRLRRRARWSGILAFRKRRRLFAEADMHAQMAASKIAR
jgi:hypothetical protein